MLNYKQELLSVFKYIGINVFTISYAFAWNLDSSNQKNIHIHEIDINVTTVLHFLPLFRLYYKANCIMLLLGHKKVKPYPSQPRYINFKYKSAVE